MKRTFQALTLAGLLTAGAGAINADQTPDAAPVTAVADDSPAGAADAAVSPSPDQPAAVGAQPAAPSSAPDSAPDSAADGDPVETGNAMIQAIKGGDWRHAVALFFTLLMMVWNWARKNVGWLKKRLAGDRAGAISVLVWAVVGGLVVALSDPGELGFALIAGSIWTAVEAIGFFVIAKKIFKPAE